MCTPPRSPQGLPCFYWKVLTALVTSAFNLLGLGRSTRCQQEEYEDCMPPILSLRHPTSRSNGTAKGLGEPQKAPMVTEFGLGERGLGVFEAKPE